MPNSTTSNTKTKLRLEELMWDRNINRSNKIASKGKLITDNQLDTIAKEKLPDDIDFRIADALIEGFK